MLKPGLKRFYKAATVAEEGAGFAVLLDGRRIRTPAQRDFSLPTRALAEAVAEEWQAQGEKITPADMPLTQLAFTAIDRIAPDLAAVADRIGRYGETDLLCYRAAAPQDLVALQGKTWDPLLAWAEDAFGATLTVTAGITPVDQAPAALAALKSPLAGLDAFRMTALAAVVQVAGSLVIGMALLRGRLDAAAAAAASQLDETYQAAKWGDDKEALDRRRALTAEIAGAARFLALL